jgi:hypothetical protein
MKYKDYTVYTLNSSGYHVDTYYLGSWPSIEAARERAERWMTGQIDGNSWPFGWTVQERKDGE